MGNDNKDARFVSMVRNLIEVGSMTNVVSMRVSWEEGAESPVRPVLKREVRVKYKRRFPENSLDKPYDV